MNRTFAACALIIALLLVANPWLAPVARSAEPALRSGRIASGVLTTSPAVDCSLVPDCRAWLQTGCRPTLAGRDPAWLASIVDVRDLADGTTPRMLVIRPGAPAGRIIGGVFVQFWRDHCIELRSASWHSFWDCGAAANPYRRYGPRPPCRKTRSANAVVGLEQVQTTLTIPPGVAWMTVSANDNVNLTWQLG